MTAEIKVVISLKDSRGSIGIQSPNCDPVFTTLEGDLEAALERVTDLVQQAREKWAENARYPKADVPQPPPPPQPSRAQSPRGQTSQAQRPQPSMF